MNKGQKYLDCWSEPGSNYRYCDHNCDQNDWRYIHYTHTHIYNVYICVYAYVYIVYIIYTIYIMENSSDESWYKCFCLHLILILLVTFRGPKSWYSRINVTRLVVLMKCSFALNYQITCYQFSGKEIPNWSLPTCFFCQHWDRMYMAVFLFYPQVGG